MLDNADLGRIREIVRDELAATRARRVAGDPIAEKFAAWATSRERFTALDALDGMGVAASERSAGLLIRVGKAAAALGYVRLRAGSGARVWYYERRTTASKAA